MTVFKTGAKEEVVSVERILGTLRKAGFGDSASTLERASRGDESHDAFAPTLFEATPRASWKSLQAGTTRPSVWLGASDSPSLA